jgi:Ala-tRNA(Pro) deacylase
MDDRQQEIFDAICALLESKELKFRTLAHSPTRTSKDSADIRGEALSKGAKAILLKVQNDFILFVFPADRKINSRKIRAYFRSLGRRAKKIRFATPDELFDLTGLPPGAVPPFGRPILDFDLFADSSLFNNDEIAFNAGSMTNSIFMDVSDFQGIAKPEVFDFVGD